jgi:CRP/FNR family transcriptional regulator, cyclic AMP receptor protein
MASDSFAASTTRTGRAPLLALDEELGLGLTPRERQLAMQTLVVPTGTLQPGSWAPPMTPPEGAEVGLLIVKGALTREVTAGGARSVELLGTSDLIRPWQEDAASFCESRWRVLETSEVAILETRLIQILSRWPQITTALVERAIRRSRWLVVQSAIAAAVGVEKKTLTLLWHIAEKWGRVENDGVVISVPLTHELLAEMAGVSRTYVTQAIGALVEAGEIRRRPDGSFVLQGESPAATLIPSSVEKR